MTAADDKLCALIGSDLGQIEMRFLRQIQPHRRARSMHVMYVAAYGEREKKLRGYPWQRRLAKLHKLQRARKAPTAATVWAQIKQPVVGRMSCTAPNDTEQKWRWRQMAKITPFCPYPLHLRPPE